MEKDEKKARVVYGLRRWSVGARNRKVYEMYSQASSEVPSWREKQVDRVSRFIRLARWKVRLFWRKVKNRHQRKP